MNSAVAPAGADPRAQGIIAILVLAVNVVVLAMIYKRAIETKTNPYKNEIFTYQKDYKLAMERAVSEGK